MAFEPGVRGESSQLPRTLLTLTLTLTQASPSPAPNPAHYLQAKCQHRQPQTSKPRSIKEAGPSASRARSQPLALLSWGENPRQEEARAHGQSGCTEGHSNTSCACPHVCTSAWARLWACSSVHTLHKGESTFMSVCALTCAPPVVWSLGEHLCMCVYTPVFAYLCTYACACVPACTHHSCPCTGEWLETGTKATGLICHLGRAPCGPDPISCHLVGVHPDSGQGPQKPTPPNPGPIVFLT